jgi:hypothetical protein
MKPPRFLATVLAVGALAGVAPARAEPPPTATTTAVDARHEAEARFLVALPAALRTGLATGVEAAYTYGRGWFRYGGGMSWGTTTEYTLTEIVRNDDIRLRLFGVAQKRLGLATMSLRLGLGGTVVYEERTRAQGSRAGLTGSALSTSTAALLPGADLEARVVLHIIRGFGVTIGGGPSLHIVNGGARAGWLGGVGITWQR